MAVVAAAAAPVPPSLGLRAEFLHLVADSTFLRRVLVHSVNNRVQDFADPLTSTLILMANSPLQLVFCEAGVLLFKNPALQVFPFDKLCSAHRAQLEAMVVRVGADGGEVYHG